MTYIGFYAMCMEHGGVEAHAALTKAHERAVVDVASRRGLTTASTALMEGDVRAEVEALVLHEIHFAHPEWITSFPSEYSGEEPEYVGLRGDVRGLGKIPSFRLGETSDFLDQGLLQAWGPWEAVFVRPSWFPETVSDLLVGIVNAPYNPDMLRIAEGLR